MLTQMPRDGAEAEQERGADDGAAEDAEGARGRVEPDGARQVGGADEVLKQELLGRCPQGARPCRAGSAARRRPRR